VLELALPQAAANLHGRALTESILGTWPKALSYLTSFAVIAIFWQGHNQVGQHVRRYDGGLMWLAFMQLACVAFLPFLTSVLGEHGADPPAQELYWGRLFVTGLVTSALWWYASSGGRLVHRGLDRRIIRHYHVLTLAAPAAFLLMMVLLIAVGVGRLIDPLLLGAVLGLAYIAVAVSGWWEPRGAGPKADTGHTPETIPTGGQRGRRDGTDRLQR
jgi:uncharacterized membrane protein